MNKKKVLIIHDGGATYFADIVSRNLADNNIEVQTLQEVLISGVPINIKTMIDNVSALIVLEGKVVLVDSITSACIAYAKVSNKRIVPITLPYAGATSASIEFFRSELPYPNICSPSLSRENSEFYREVISALSIY